MMEIFLSLEKYPALCELKSDEAVFHFSSFFLQMPSSSESVLAHIAEYPKIHLRRTIVLVYAQYEL
jgi:hypothetical protein